MAKWHGALGFAEPEQESAPGVWEPPKVIERFYFGEVPRKKLTTQSADKLVDDISLANEISVVADPYAMSHLGLLRYATYGGFRWEIASFEPVYPRINLTLGGLYHGEIPT